MGSRQIVCNVSFNFPVRYELCMCAEFEIFGTERENALADMLVLRQRLDTSEYLVAQE